MELVMMFGIDALTLLIAGLRNLTGIWSYLVEQSFLNSRMIFFYFDVVGEIYKTLPFISR